MHEFTDGCAAKYKSRHCLGDLSCSLADYGYLIQGNFFATSHAKGEQDAAGSHIKQKVSQAVLRRTTTIKNAKEIYDYLLQNFCHPAVSTFSTRTKSAQLKRRIFFHAPNTRNDNSVTKFFQTFSLPFNPKLSVIFAFSLELKNK